MSRDTIFISHARIPKDNEFVLWLASRLQMLGYKVWCDLLSMAGGEHDYWGKVIQPQISEQAAKFILVITKSGIVRPGIIDEFSFAREVATEKNLSDFVIPIKIEDVPFTARISLSTYNVIDCSSNWHVALSSLVKKFEQDNVPKTNEHGLNNDFKNITHDSYDKILPRKERYFSSWVKPHKLPESFFLFQYSTEGQAKAVLKNYYKEYPITRHGNYLVSFHKEVCSIPKEDVTGFDFGAFEVQPKNFIEIKIAEIKNNTSIDFPTKEDSEYLLKRILNWSLSVLLTKRGIKAHEMSNKKQCYYFTKDYKTGNKITVNYPNRKKKKNLIGKFNESFWHFGISFMSQLEPYPSYNLKSHILFSDDGIKIWSNSSKLHSARRKKGRTWFNEHWRDQLMAFLFYAKKHDEETYISFPISDKDNLEIPCLTESFYSDFGYNEPNSDDRLDIVNTPEEELEKVEELDEEG